MAAALDRLGLQAGPQTLLSTLSGGQRTRIGLAALVFNEPDFILLDEPTNNLDRDGRRAVIDLLADWRGGAIVVSHDRELLETMDAIVELTALGATRYGGNWSHYRERKALELAAAQHELADAEQARRRTRPQRTQAVAERKARKDGAGKRKRAKGDIPRIQLGTHAGTAARPPARAMPAWPNAAARRPSSDAAAARERIEVLQPLTVAAAVDRTAGRQDRPEDRCGERRPRRSAGDPRPLLHHHRSGAHRRHRPERLGQDDAARPHHRTSWRRGRARCAS